LAIIISGLLLQCRAGQGTNLRCFRSFGWHAILDLSWRSSVGCPA